MLSGIQHIILVDDDEDECFLFKDALVELGSKADFLYFRNGKETISYLQSVPDIASHLVFLDLNMPSMSGKDCLKILREDIKLKNIPIAMYSTTSLQDDVEETQILGANIYIKKPINFSGIKSTLDKMLAFNWDTDSYLGAYLLS